VRKTLKRMCPFAREQVAKAARAKGKTDKQIEQEIGQTMC
jgi:hypothetical protein